MGFAPGWGNGSVSQEKARKLIKSSRADDLPYAALRSMTGRIAPAACLIEEPHAPFSLINPHFKQARGRHIVLLVAEIMGLAHARDQRLIVRPELGQHVEGVDIVGVV